VCVEAIFNRHPAVFRSALISLGGKAPFVPAVVVELENGHKPEEMRLCLELQTLGSKHQSTRPIRNFYIHPSFPVDVRHNAKIHRVELGKWAAKQDPLPTV
jgi:acyl-coenzyme A synthetase/AMP-(fatty) acid ligase